MNIDPEKLLDEADLLIASSRYDAAIAKYNYILEHASDCDEAYLMRGALFGQVGNIDSAISDIEESIRLDGTNDSAFLMLAMLYEKKSDNQKANELCRKSIAINKKNQESISFLVKLLVKLGDEALDKNLLEKADANFGEALTYNVNDASLFYKAALVASKRGNFERSIKLAERAIKINNNYIEAQAHIASVYEMIGDVDYSNKIVENLQRDYPSNSTVNIVFAQFSLRTKQQEKGINVLENMLLRKNITKANLISACMFLGKLYDSIKQYEPAIKYFKQANSVLYTNYDPSSYEKYISSLINYFSSDKYQSIPESDNSTDELIFIVGMPRSGTSLLEQIISSHSNVYGAGELTHVFNVVDTMQVEVFSNAYPGCLDKANTKLMNSLASKLYSKIRGEDLSSKKITDKLPHNYHHIGFLHKLFPNAKFINCTRDARDSCLSCYFQNFAGYHPYSSSLRTLGLHYLEYERLMNHWINVLDIPILTVSYEDVVLDTRKEVEIIFNFLELEWEEECMKFYENKRTVATASYNQVNKNIYTASVGRWKNYKGHISELLEVLDE
jgi:tetratricopeptide (TPR) repeat protein